MIIASIYWAFTTCRHYASLSLILIVTLWSGYHYLHFIDEETDSEMLKYLPQTIELSSQRVAEPGLKVRPLAVPGLHSL